MRLFVRQAVLLNRARACIAATRIVDGDDTCRTESSRMLVSFEEQKSALLISSGAGRGRFEWGGQNGERSHESVFGAVLRCTGKRNRDGH